MNVQETECCYLTYLTVVLICNKIIFQWIFFINVIKIRICPRAVLKHHIAVKTSP